MPAFLTDRELADLLRVEPCTISRLAKRGPSKRSRGTVDIRLAEPIVIGKQRRWPAEKVYQLLGLAPAQNQTARAFALA